MRWLLVPCLLALTACEPALSTRPLVASGGEQPLPGLWAMLEPNCPRPSNGAVQSWPACATPVWVQPGEATMLAPAPVRSAFVVSAGEPQILQVPRAAEDSELRFGYYAVRAEGGPPHRAAAMWLIACEPERGESADAIDETSCLVEDEAELRRLARLAVSEEPTGRAVYVGPH